MCIFIKVNFNWLLFFSRVEEEEEEEEDWKCIYVFDEIYCKGCILCFVVSSRMVLILLGFMFVFFVWLF